MICLQAASCVMSGLSSWIKSTASFDDSPSLSWSARASTHPANKMSPFVILLLAATSVTYNTGGFCVDILIESLGGDPKLVCEFISIKNYLAVVVFGVAFLLDLILNGLHQQITMLSFLQVDVCLSLAHSPSAGNHSIPLPMQG